MLPTEQLLYPRIKVIERWPDMGRDGYHQGQIIILKLHDGKQWYQCKRDLTIYEAFYLGYPHLFQLLPWWSEREQKDLPEFLIYQKDTHYHKGTVVKVDQWSWEWRGKVWWFRDASQPPVNFCTRFIGDYLPATLADYEQYNQQKEGMNG